MTQGALRLGQVADRVVMLDVVCNQCKRRDCLSTARLAREHGSGMTMPALLAFLTADCERRRNGSMHRACGAHFPQLPVLFRE